MFEQADKAAAAYAFQLRHGMSPAAAADSIEEQVEKLRLGHQHMEMVREAAMNVLAGLAVPRQQWPGYLNYASRVDKFRRKLDDGPSLDMALETVTAVHLHAGLDPAVLAAIRSAT
jgi:hypothetical protein